MEYWRLRKMVKAGWKVVGHSRRYLDRVHFRRGSAEVDVVVYNAGTIPKIMAYAAKHNMIG